MLIDEIDKAESDVPNGLLEALGAGTFSPQGCDSPVMVKGIAPLVLITTNEERALPDAFVRRCLVLHLELPGLPEESEAFRNLLVERGRAHFQAAMDNVLTEAANLLIDYRIESQRLHRLPLPGQAEYLDLLRAVINLGNTPERQLELLSEIARYTVRKHPQSGAADAKRS
ncbi:MAG: hypothetical protein ACRERU_14745 [Methylococcales bacterium]